MSKFENGCNKLARLYLKYFKDIRSYRDFSDPREQNNVRDRYEAGVVVGKANTVEEIKELIYSHKIESWAGQKYMQQFHDTVVMLSIKKLMTYGVDHDEIYNTVKDANIKGAMERARREMDFES